MEEVYRKARAKINLTLDVLGKRRDGYHDIKSVFQKINFYDEIYVKKANEFKIESNIEELNNDNNILYKAFVKLKDKYPQITNVYIKLNKRIPMQAGMGGGSTDCASFILCMNRLFNLNLSQKEIESIGKSLGADVVSCFYNHAVLVEGIGEVITPIETEFKYYILIIKPKMSCNTKKMYEELDRLNEMVKKHDTDFANKIIKSLENNDIEVMAENLYNKFEYVLKNNEEIQVIKNDLISNGASGSLMTGSGSCVFGIYPNKKIARQAYKKLKDKYQIYICTSYNSQRRKAFDR